MKKVKLYVITPIFETAKGYQRFALKILQGGADWLQLRSQNLSDKELLETAVILRRLTRKYQVKFIVNNRLDIAFLSQADGLHLGQDDLPLDKIRKYLPADFIVGLSTHSLKQARKAIKLKPDYISVGPIFETPTKPQYRVVRIKLLKQVRQITTLPIVAIGSLNFRNIKEVIAAGADIVAVVTAISRASDVYKATKLLKKIIRSIMKC